MGTGASTSKEELDKQHVVIIGAGYGGVQVAVDLKKGGVPFTIVDPKEFFHHSVGALRAAVNPDFTKQIAIPLKEAFGDSFVQGEVRGLNIETKKVSVGDGLADLEYTHLVLAVGCAGSPPNKTEEVTVDGLQKEMEKVADNIGKAAKIVIVGGGPVGVEMAGEIRDKYKDKNITLVHSRDQFMDFGDKFSNNVVSTLETAGVKVVLGRKVKNLDLVNAQNVLMDNGDTLETDLMIPCIGNPPKITFLHNILPKACFDDNKKIKVDPYLEVYKMNDVFAIGDCCNTPEDKMAVYAMNHGELVAGNIIRAAQGQVKKTYQQAFVGMVVTFGERSGIGIFNGWNLPSFICARLKGGDLFTPKQWSLMGIKQPT